MASSNVCWGIELGAAGIKAIKLEAAGEGRVRVLDFAVVPHAKVLSTPGVDANDVLRMSLGNFLSQYDVNKAVVAMSMPGHSGFARFAKLPPVDPKKVADIVKFEAAQQIPFPLEQVEWDFQTFVSPDSPDIEVGIFAITKDRVNERLSMLEDVGIVPNTLVLSPISVYNALAFDLDFGPTTPGTIIVDVGTTSTDLVIATPGRMWVRTFPLGGHQFTQALVDQFQLSYPKAEKLKREAEDTKHARQVFQAMRPVFTDLAQDIQRSIGYYQSINKDAQLTRLIGVGSTFRLPGLRKYLKQQLSMDVYRVEEFKKADIDDARKAALGEASLNLITAYGLALQGLGLNAVSGNLMPVQLVRRGMWREKVPWFGLAAGVAVLAAGVMFVRPVKDHFDVAGQTVDPVVNSAVSRAKQIKSEAETAGVTQQGEPDMRAANLVALLDKRDLYENITADVGEMFRVANERGATWASSLGVKDAAPLTGPAYTLVSLTTEYKAPVAADLGMDPSGGSPFMDPNGPKEPEGVSTMQRIHCTMVMSTTLPEARRLTNQTVEAWIRANVKRDGVPYELRFVEPVFTVTDPGREANTGGGSAGPGGRRGPAGDGFGRDGMPPPRPVNPNLGAEIGAPQRANDESLRSRSVALDALNGLAPIAEPTPPATAPSIVTVNWYAVIVPPQAAEEAPK